jgi:hypothetical protein
MARRVLYHFKARTRQGVENYINALPLAVHLYGPPQYITENNKPYWIVWFTVLDRIDAQIIDNIEARTPSKEAP